MNKRPGMNKGAMGLAIFFSALFFLLFGRFIFIQVTGEVDGRILAEGAERLYKRMETIDAKRGTIYDENGEVIAEDTYSYKIVAVLDKSLENRHVEDPADTADKLAPILDMEREDLYNRLSSDKKQIEFGSAGRDLTPEQRKQIEELNITGINFIRDAKRFYPNGVFSSHLIGYAQPKENKDGEIEYIGQMGIEQTYNDMLTGVDGKYNFQADAWNIILPNSEELLEEPKDGKDIYMTLNKHIQTFLEDAMNQVQQEYEPVKMMAIVAEAKTGKVVGLAQRPTFEANTRDGINNSWHNEVIESSFEPGSTMKIFTLASAIEEDSFNGNATYKSGTYQIGSDRIRDHNGGRGWGEITYLEGFQRSSNVAMANLLNNMGHETFRKYLDKFRFGVPTGIELPGEASGSIVYNYELDRITTAFGQGTTVNALQMVQAMTAITNNGKMMKPYLIDRIVDPYTQKVKETKPTVVDTPISKETAKKTLDIMETVVSSEAGTGKAYQLDGYSVAGKTGTAQIWDPSTNRYMKGWDNYIFSFMGTAPAEDPELIMYVMVQQPNLDDEKYENGAVPVSKIFNPVMKNSLQYLTITPTTAKAAKTIELPSFEGNKVTDVQKQLGEEGVQTIIIGNGSKVTHQLPVEGEKILAGGKVILRTDGDLSVPDMIGWSKRDVLKVAEIAELPFNFVGQGYAVKQSLKPNSPVKEGDPLVVNFNTQEQIIKEENREPKEPEEDAPLN
ncbi:penicillin-binding protein [Mangrovibacillus cuniculi]|uniref:serine-type D-Ala-D-Ala carboxypeptidase n=1 Tax=Mangrovibacillus cuniculi TaxID=2593652 RepID=A0A7S8HEY5_9BACI|nr:penicillin-binding transpeptidase domain-containing protein [Mangrovibacillus cuniculi]QPC46253.1 penicillin-binding protein [Mangrovibacillus cuniculi]